MTSGGSEEKREGRGTEGGLQLHAWVTAGGAQPSAGVQTAVGCDFDLETLATDIKAKFNLHKVGFPEFTRAVT